MGFGRSPTSEPPPIRVVMMIVIKVILAWLLFGAIAAVMNFGPALVTIVVGGPVSLFRTFLAM